jgi:hypothetical protein
MQVVEAETFSGCRRTSSMSKPLRKAVGQTFGSGRLRIDRERVLAFA